MSTTNNGGPAFPLENPRMLEDGELFKQFPGMSLRDWFAGQAIGAVIRQCAPDTPEQQRARGKRPVEYFAECAYAVADALLAEREVKP